MSEDDVIPAERRRGSVADEAGPRRCTARDDGARARWWRLQGSGTRAPSLGLSIYDRRRAWRTMAATALLAARRAGTDFRVVAVGSRALATASERPRARRGATGAAAGAEPVDVSVPGLYAGPPDPTSHIRPLHITPPANETAAVRAPAPAPQSALEAPPAHAHAVPLRPADAVARDRPGRCACCGRRSCTRRTSFGRTTTSALRVKRRPLKRVRRCTPYALS